MITQSSNPAAASGGLLSFSNNWKISTKIFAGFSSMLVIVAVVSFMAWRTFGSVTEMFETYAHRMAVVSDAQDVERDFLITRRFVTDYGLTGAEKYVADVEKQRAILRDATAKALQRIVRPDRRQKMEEAIKHLDSYFAAFDKVVPAKREQIKLTAEVLDPSGLKMRENADALQSAAANAGDSNMSTLAGAATEQVMRARLNVEKFLARHDQAAADKTEQSLNALDQLTGRIETAAGSGELRSQVGEFRALAAKYHQDCRRAIELGHELENLMFTELPNVAKSQAAAITAIRESAATEAQTRKEDALALMASSSTLIIGVSLGGLGLGMALAFFIGKGIGSPIRQIAAVLLELAKGNKNVEVPYAHRGDEVGDNARAAQTFKENLLQIERMEQERKEAEGTAAAQRKADMLKLADNFQAAVGEIIAIVSSASTELEASAQGLTHTASHTQELSTSVAAASEQASANVQSVASATEELTGSVDEISRQVNESSRIANEAVNQAQQTDERMNELSQAATRIGDVMKLITTIAEQTNLLALNATIEAARAGEAGKGFAVVAQEVKTLAAQTAKATEEVGAQINGIQNATRDSVAAIKQIDATIHRISEIASAVASAAQEQGAATQEIARNVHQAAQGTLQVAQSIGEVNKGAGETGSASSQVLTAAKSMAHESNRLKIEVDKFLAGVRAA
jgi:methyl-accepting chemotaxis protein/CHASE3 domain sensor protein